MKKKPAKLIVQLLSLGFFFTLLMTDHLKIWLAIFLGGAFIAPLLGRVYCGFLCPVHTGTLSVTILKKKINRKPVPVPEVLKKPWIRFGSVILLLAAFVAGEVSGRRIPALLLMLLTGMVLTFFFQEALWHRYFCPYGAILKITSVKTKRGMTIQKERCKDNNVCRQVCPAEAVIKVNGHSEIDNSECLVCMRCRVNCKEKAISYK